MGFWFLLVRFEFRILVYVLDFAWCCFGFVAGLVVLWWLLVW